MSAAHDLQDVADLADLGLEENETQRSQTGFPAECSYRYIGRKDPRSDVQGDDDRLAKPSAP